MSYINIHSHFKPRMLNEFVIRNAYLFEMQVDNCNYRLSNGLHPWFTNVSFDTLKLKSILQNNNSAAIGECGLDRLKGANLATQIQVFEKHLKLGLELNLPIIVHCVRAYDELYSCLKSYPNPVVLHAYSASEKQFERFLSEENIFYSLGIREMKRLKYVTDIPLEKLFLETDTQNYLIADVYEEMCQLKSISIEKLKENLRANAHKISIV